MGRGWEGLALKVMRGRDFAFTVTAAEDVTTDCRRVRFADGGMLDATGVHPTMWVRLWFPEAGRPHQRAYTLVDPDPAAGTFGIDFALHDGPASRWASAAAPGDSIQATVQGSAFAAPEPTPRRMFLVGDRASAPAIGSLLRALPGVPATIWLETQHDSDERLPVSRSGRDHHDFRFVPREDAGGRLAAQVRTALPGLLGDPAEAYVWIACDTVTTRELARFVRKELGVPGPRTHALGYWRP